MIDRLLCIIIVYVVFYPILRYYAHSSQARISKEINSKISSSRP